MGNNHSKLCSGDPEREYRRAQQDMLQQLYTPSPDSAQATVHIQFLEEMSTEPGVFCFKVATPRAAETATAAVSSGAEAAEPCGDVMEKLEPRLDVRVRSEPNSDIVVGAEARLSELGLTLSCLCNQVLSALQVVEMPSGDSFARTQGRSAVEALSPSPLDSQPSVLSSGSQARSPPVGGAESLNTGDAHRPKEDVFLANDRKAPRGTDLELAPEDVSGATEEPTPGQTQLEEASSGETLEEASEERADVCPDVIKTDLGTKELVETLLRLGDGLFRAASEPLSILKEREAAAPEGYCGGGNVDAQLEGPPKRAQRETLATVDSRDETEQPTASRTFPVSESHGRSIHALCEKMDPDDVLLASDAEDSHSLLKEGAIPTPEATKENERQMSVVQDTEAQPSPIIAETTGAASSPKALFKAAETGQGGPLFSSAEPTAQVSRTQDDRPGAQLSPVSVSVSGPALEDGYPGQRG